jgi:hypothetical protein
LIWGRPLDSAKARILSRCFDRLTWRVTVALAREGLEPAIDALRTLPEIEGDDFHQYDQTIHKLSDQTADLIDAICEQDELIGEMMGCLKGYRRGTPANCRRRKVDAEDERLGGKK